MEYEASRTMPAESRIVFDIAADVAAMNQWLPEEVRVHEVAPGLAEAAGSLVDVREERDGMLLGAPERLRLEWGSRDGPDYTGWLQVTDQGAGTSEVVVHLSFRGHRPPGEDAGPNRDVMQRMLEDSLERLAEEVGRRVTQPGS
ncbi:SRPBCC family protein [Thermomonospora sp. CIF 1]|uniref:SRPBCC family protein n=1 Tax=Thermomonospora sp. CIF 1 TaxID=1916083 RepID=UPI000B22E246|nr:SRPBCC family protein [Thermomonospora sp. CIF 1]PKK15103.1 MAG: hypothetical protein BUE48_005965 [Thermomonospora sp. CIF 1]